MKKSLWLISLIITGSIALTACQEKQVSPAKADTAQEEPTNPPIIDTANQDTGNTEPAPVPDANYVECKDPRPEVCTREYKPVCAQKETGIVCVTTPCPTTENVTASNACTACSNPKIISYIPDGACKE